MLQKLRRRLPGSGTIRKKVFQILQNPSAKSCPVFLVGNGRSGTTLLVSRLGSLPEVALYNEDHPAAFDRYFLRSYARIHQLISRSHAAVVLFKPIKDTYRAAQLLEQFPHGKILFMFRNFRDVVRSARRKFYEEPAMRGVRKINQIVPPVDRWVLDDFEAYVDVPPPAKTRQQIRSLYHPDLSLDSKIALHWLFQNRLYFDLELSASRRVRLVQYEKLVEDPAGSLEAVCAFIGVRFQPQAAADIRPPGRPDTAAQDIAPAIARACKALYQDLCQAVETDG